MAMISLNPRSDGEDPWSAGFAAVAVGRASVDETEPPGSAHAVSVNSGGAAVGLGKMVFSVTAP